MKSLIPVVMAGILGIYGMIVAVIISQRGNHSTIKLRADRNTRRKVASLTWLQVWCADSVAW